MPKTQNNEFIRELLSLQQDGRQAISAPTNWTTQEPLLDVETDLDDVVKELAQGILKGGGENNTARWHFFIGSPGNGKSAAMGKLCRHLVKNQSCRILDEHDVSIENLDSTTIPYALRVFEGENRFASAMIVQDASVVRNPFAGDVDPASELITTLEEAWEKGMSLVVCANRGVIEKAYHERYLDRDFNKKRWFKLLQELIESANVTLRGDLGENWHFDSGRSVFQIAKTTYSYLDNHSLLLGSCIFDDVIRKATDKSNWSACSSCDVASLCPFRANRDWLVNEDARARFLDVIRRSEVLSGQIIVFREALAFLSLILAGCPRDYGNVHPCDWVRGKVNSNDLFSLAMRRIYMSVFAAFSRYGMEIDPLLYRRQVEAISLLRSFVENDGRETGELIDHVINGLPPSTDVGVGRLAGMHGTLTEIDPWRECLPPSFLDEWDGDLSVMANREHPLFTEIEKRCTETWAYLEEVVESTASHEVPRCHWALKRWSSNFLVHFGGLLEGRTCWAKELEEFIKVLETLKKDPPARSTEEKRLIRELDGQLEKLLSARTSERSNQDIVPLSESVTLLGRWVTDKLRPHIDISRKTASLFIAVKFQSGQIAAIGARAFLWLSRHLRSRLEAQCFPKELLMGAVDARIRAAVRGSSAYAFSDNDVELKVSTGRKESFTLSRFDGDVHVERNQ